MSNIGLSIYIPEQYKEELAREIETYEKAKAELLEFRAMITEEPPIYDSLVAEEVERTQRELEEQLDCTDRRLRIAVIDKVLEYEKAKRLSDATGCPCPKR